MPGSNSRPNVSEGYEVPLSYRGDRILENCPITTVIPGTYLTKDQHPPSNLFVYSTIQYSTKCVLVCVFSSHSFWASSSLDVPAGVTQEEGHTGFLIHLLSAVRALIFLARRIQPFLSLVYREVEFCVLTNELIVLHPLGIFSFSFYNSF